MKKRFCYFMLFPLGISLFSCNEDNQRGENHTYTMENDDHFTFRVDVKCQNGDTSSLSPDYEFTSVANAKEASVVLEELTDGYRQKEEKVEVVVKSDSGEEKVYEVENKLHPDHQESLLVYYGILTDLPEGSLHFKVNPELAEQEVELKTNYSFPLDENNQYQAYFSGANNLDQMDFERLGYNAQNEIEYLGDHLYIKYNFDLGFGTNEMNFNEFLEYCMEHKNDIAYHKYKTSDAPYVDIYSKDEYVAFACFGSYQPDNIEFKNKNRHLDKSMISMIEESTINSGNKIGIRYSFKSPDSMKIIMDMANWLIPHDLIGIAFDEFDGLTSRTSNFWFQLESVNGIMDNTRKYLDVGVSGLKGYAKTSDFTSENNNEIRIVYNLTSAGLAHKDELSRYKFNVYSGGSATFDANTNKLVVKAKAPYLCKDTQYYSRIYMDMRMGV